MSVIKVAAIQMVSLAQSYQQNLKRATALIEQAAQQGAELVVLPENFLTFGETEPPSKVLQYAFMQTFSAMAKKLNLDIHAGTFPMEHEVLGQYFPLYTGLEQEKKDESTEGANRPYAASIVFSSQGNVASCYTKIHLFNASVNDGVKQYRESDTFRYGKRVPVLHQTKGVNVGLSVCYDLRFSELFLRLSQMGAHIISLPSAFTAATGEAHWETLVRARAIEYQCYVVAVNQGGKHSNGRETWGGTMIVDPWGTVLASMDKGEGVILCDLDIAYLTQRRQSMPIESHRRL